MVDLNQKYVTILDNIKSKIQLSPELVVFLDTEEDADYKNIVANYENEIHEVHQQVAAEAPLQLEAFELHLLNDQFEGLYLPKALGYAVLRGRVSSTVKYYRTQEHFSKVLKYIITSTNFEQIKQRVGQSIQIGFALSSDIWITNIIEGVTNKKVKAFLESQKLQNYRDQKIRNSGLVKYRKQFQSLNYQTAKFPQTVDELLAEIATLKDFLKYRSKGEFDNTSLNDSINALLANEAFYDNKDYLEICIIIGLHYDLDEKGSQLMTNVFNETRKNPNHSTDFFELYNQHWNEVKGISTESEKRFSILVDKSTTDNISSFFTTLDDVNTLGYIHEDAANHIREFYYKHEGLSIENEAIRNSILAKFQQFLNNLSITNYTEYFEINKSFIIYMDIFSNQKFNQELKDLSLKYVRKGLKIYTDKRGKEYQDIKKFVKTTFVDYKFMTAKEIVELFKTKRKPKVA